MESIFSGASAFMAQQIADTPAIEDPFEHCVVDDVLPQGLIDEIYDRWPSEDAMTPLSETGRNTHYPERYVMLMTEEFLSRLSKLEREFWQGVSNVVLSQAVVLACVNKFQDVLKPRIAHLESERVTINPEMLIISDHSDYKIGPHTDSKGRFVSMLLYLSPDPKYRSYGTGLYTPKDPQMPVNHVLHHPFEKFNLHSRVDYKPNRVVIFPRTDRSYHGVEPVPVADCDRRLIIVNIRAPDGAI